MIGFIRGKVLNSFKSGKAVTSLVVWPNENVTFGVAYTILVSDITGAKNVKDDVAELWTFSVHSDNDLYLIGMDSADKMKIFLKLLEVSGVGPRTAMTIVDTVGVDGITNALVMNDVSVFSKVSGIGQKTAAKIVLELAGKDLQIESILKPQQINLSAYNDVIATLQKLGYSSNSAKEAVAKASAELDMQPELTLAEKVKITLAK